MWIIFVNYPNIVCLLKLHQVAQHSNRSNRKQIVIERAFIMCSHNSIMILTSLDVRLIVAIPLKLLFVVVVILVWLVHSTLMHSVNKTKETRKTNFSEHCINWTNLFPHCLDRFYYLFKRFLKPKKKVSLFGLSSTTVSQRNLGK